MVIKNEMGTTLCPCSGKSKDISSFSLTRGRYVNRNQSYAQVQNLSSQWEVSSMDYKTRSSGFNYCFRDKGSKASKINILVLSLFSTDIAIVH